MDEALKRKLVAMAERDLRVRERLAESGELYEGYHPEMEKVHLENAAELEKILNERDWTGLNLAGREGAEAAWLIVQHSISRPEFQRRCLELINEAVEAGEAEAWQAAYLYDRICFFENRPQRYGTQSDWNDKGEMAVYDLEDETKVNDFRREVGLSPLVDKTIEMTDKRETPPKDLAARRREAEIWAKRVGWRK